MSEYLSRAGRLLAITLLSAVLLSSCGDGDNPDTATVDQVAWVAVSPAARGIGQTGSIVIFEASNPTATTTIGSAGQYVGLHWSPDGTRLAALDLRDNAGGLHLLVFDRASPGTPPLDLPGDWMDYAWSPDSTRILALSRTDLQVFDTAGKSLGAIALPPRADGGMSVFAMSHGTWTSDSGRAAAFVNEHLLLIDRDGHGQAVDLASSGLGIGAPGFQFMGWTDSTHLTANYSKPLDPASGGTPSPPDRNTVEITVKGDKLAWKLSPFDPGRFFSSLPPGSEAVATALGSRLVSQSLTADGSAIFTTADAATGGQPSFAYWVAGKPHKLDLSQFDLDSRPAAVHAHAIDVVLVHR